MSQDPKNPVSTTRKTIRIVEALQELGRARLTDIADEMGMSKSTVHSHLSTLEEGGFVVKEDKEYRLGLRFLELGGFTRSRMDLYKTAEPELGRLAAETGELVNLMTEEYGRGIYLYRAKGERAVGLNTYAGYRTPLHTTALGKAIIAHLPRERVSEIVDRHGLESRTAETVTDREKLFDRLDEIRSRGFALDDEEYISGVRCVAAPVLDTDDRAIGSISVSAPTSRLSSEKFEEEVPNLVRSTANVIELNINYS
ncbi:IclR family transcriptional regulator [Halobacteriales archaeon QS_1_68_17]|nr:MAG: IclR family transcriptional regulator [Halobacteriales archaeon QS_1_68_17]